jgi:hypothetical protein
MQIKILAAVLALAALGTAGTAMAQPYPPGVFVQPPPHRMAPPRPGPGQAWVAPHWEMRHGRQAWVPGRWVQVRQAPHHRPPRWERHGPPRAGGWDRDGDGVPDRHDRRPLDPYRR